MTQHEIRERTIVRTSLIGIAANLGLSAVKVFAGIAAHSIAIILDAVNNLSDALSSVITIIGTKLAGKPADKKHPFGHGRIEYLTSMVIAVIVLYAGVTALTESVKKLFAPVTPDYAPVTLIIITVAVVVKLLLGAFVKRTGKKVNSDSLIASGQDALLDAVISCSTLLAASIYLFTGLSLEPYIGAVISFAIIKAGIEILMEGSSAILGERIESHFAKEIKRTIIHIDPEIHGAFDLVLNNYGPDRYLGSVHIEVPASWTASRIDETTRKIQHEVYEKHNVMLSGIGIYSVNEKNPEINKIRNQISHIVMEHDHILGMHGFYLNLETKKISFDIIVAFEAANMKALYEHVRDDVCAAFPDYDVSIQMDTDISD